MTNRPGLPRRTLLALAAGLAAAAGRATQSAVTLLVAGPDDSEAAAWGARLQPVLQLALGSGRTLILRHAGGRDGVTGCNQFQAWAAPDGSSALLFPGAAALAWLAGDDRVRFDAFRLLPVLALTSAGVMMCRRPWPARVRLACPGRRHPSVAGLLGLELLGLQPEAAPTEQDATSAVLAGAADAAFLHGEAVPSRVEALRRAGLAPLFAVGSPDGGRDPAFPDIPTLPERLASRSSAPAPLEAAWLSAASASVVQFVLALPALCPPDRVADWRRAGAAASSDPTLQQRAVAGGLRLLSPDLAPGMLAAMAAGIPAQFALRRWLAGQEIGRGRPG